MQKGCAGALPSLRTPEADSAPHPALPDSPGFP